MNPIDKPLYDYMPFVVCGVMGIAMLAASAIDTGAVWIRVVYGVVGAILLVEGAALVVWTWRRRRRRILEACVRQLTGGET